MRYRAEQRSALSPAHTQCGSDKCVQPPFLLRRFWILSCCFFYPLTARWELREMFLCMHITFAARGRETVMRRSGNGWLEINVSFWAGCRMNELLIWTQDSFSASPLSVFHLPPHLHRNPSSPFSPAHFKLSLKSAIWSTSLCSSRPSRSRTERTLICVN